MTGLAEKKPLDKDGGTRRGNVPSPRLRQLCFAVIRRAFKTALTLGLISRNPCEGIKQPRIPANQRELWTRDQVQHFLDSTKADRYYAFYVLSLMSGARQGELLGLTWENVDLEAGTIRIVGTLIESGGHIIGVQAPKTPAALRTITIPPTAVEALKRHRLRMFQEGKAHFPGVFPGQLRAQHDERYNQWTSKAHLTRTFQKAVRKAGLPMIRMHDLRHLHATMAIATGGDIRTVSARLGHSKPSVTLDIYAHAFAGNDRKVSASVDELVFGPLPVKTGEKK
jgi:integrase